MISSIKKFFDQQLVPTENIDIDHQLKLATTALLIEMMQQDDQVHDNEIQTVQQSLKKTFELSDSEAQQLYSLAHQELSNSTDYFQFTHLIAKNYSQQQKIQLIKNLWQVAYADDHLDALEEHMIRRIADLIYVSHKDFIQTKLSVSSAKQ